MQRRTLFRSAGAIALVTLLGAGLVTAVLAADPGKWEVTDSGKSWPHEVTYSGEPHNGKSAAQLLTEIHDKAMMALDAESDPAKKPPLLNAIKHSLECLALDGNWADPAKAHHSTNPSNPAHSGAKAKVLAAHGAAFPASGPVDWGVVGSELDHGH